jgi:hypothetical protein
MKHRTSIKTAMRIWSLAVIPAGLIITMLFPRFVAWVFGLAPAIVLDAFYVQTVCPLVKGQLHLFWKALGYASGFAAHRLVAYSRQA